MSSNNCQNLPTVCGNPTVIPIAVGKGGVGTTFVMANLAVALARQGRANFYIRRVGVQRKGIITGPINYKLKDCHEHQR